ncbi:MAG: peptidoglycan DD-metalloendopeptidase family protein [Hyphomicrobiales bacterium]|nr:peptidoglycan DD-metalloendopeptidase family protein [Hyphomicrobiales bacterium]
MNRLRFLPSSSVKTVCAARCAVWAAFAVAVLAAFAPDRAAAQSPKPPASPKAAPPKLTPEEAARLVEQHRDQLQQVEGEKENVSREVEALAFERARLKSELIEKAQKIKATERRVSAVESEVNSLREREAAMRADLAGRQKEMAQLLAVLQRLGRQPPPVMVTKREDALEMVRSGMLLAHSFKTIRPMAEKLAGDLERLETLSAELERRKGRQRVLLADLARRRQEIEPVLAAQREQLKVGQARLDMLAAASVKHAQAISNLGELLVKLDKELAMQTNLGVYEAELKSGAAVEIRPEAKKLAFVQPARLKPALPFQETKGLLPIPADGVRKRSFGQPDGYGGTYKGIAIETRDRAQITAPCDGWVQYADNLKNYGPLLIINAGGGYHILLAGMEQFQVTVNQFVLAGEPIAVMGSQKGADGSSESAKPLLYVEFRKDQRPIDPDPWWSSGVEKG